MDELDEKREEGWLMYESVHYTVSPLTEEDSAWWTFNTEVLVQLAKEYREEEWEKWLEQSEGR